MRNHFEDIYHKVYASNDNFGLKAMFEYILSNYQGFSPTWHALGFIHCKLAGFEHGDLRLHIWPNNETHVLEQREKIHDHKFSLNSYVVLGGIRNEIFSISKSKKSSADYQSHKVIYEENSSKLIPLGDFYSVSPGYEEVISEGQFYFVSSKDFHRSSICSDNLTVTLVANKYDNSKDPIMLGDVYNDQDLIREKVLFDLERWRYYLDLINKFNKII